MAPAGDPAGPAVDDRTGGPRRGPPVGAGLHVGDRAHLHAGPHHQLDPRVGPTLHRDPAAPPPTRERAHCAGAPHHGAQRRDRGAGGGHDRGARGSRHRGRGHRGRRRGLVQRGSGPAAPRGGPHPLPPDRRLLRRRGRVPAGRSGGRGVHGRRRVGGLGGPPPRIPPGRQRPGVRRHHRHDDAGDLLGHGPAHPDGRGAGLRGHPVPRAADGLRDRRGGRRAHRRLARDGRRAARLPRGRAVAPVLPRPDGAHRATTRIRLDEHRLWPGVAADRRGLGGLARGRRPRRGPRGSDGAAARRCRRPDPVRCHELPHAHRDARRPGGRARRDDRDEPPGRVPARPGQCRPAGVPRPRRHQLDPRGGLVAGISGVRPVPAGDDPRRPRPTPGDPRDRGGPRGGREAGPRHRRHPPAADRPRPAAQPDRRGGRAAGRGARHRSRPRRRPLLPATPRRR